MPKTSLEVKLDYIHQDVKDVKLDIKEMKDSYVSRREFEDKIADIEEKLIDKVISNAERIDTLYKMVYGVASAVGLIIIGALMDKILN